MRIKLIRGSMAWLAVRQDKESQATAIKWLRGQR